MENITLVILDINSKVIRIIDSGVKFNLIMSGTEGWTIINKIIFLQLLSIKHLIAA